MNTNDYQERGMGSFWTGSRFECKHCTSEKVELYQYEFANGNTNYRHVCGDCGENSTFLKHAAAATLCEDLSTLPTYDPDYWRIFRNKIREAEWEKKKVEIDKKRQKEKDEWFREHSLYLSTAIWKSKRSRVLNRDENTCQACFSRQATEVHHLTYERWKNEPLFDLVSVCSVCHAGLHPHMKTGEKA